MALIKIKQINNSPASTGGLIVYDGNNNVWSNNDDGAILISKGTTGERPGTPTEGMIRYNTTENCLEGYVNGAWGCIVSQGAVAGNTYQHQFVGGTRNSWMFFADSNATPPSGPESSGTVAPAVFPFSATATSLTFSNREDNADIDVEFYKNGTFLFTWSVTNSHTAFKTSALSTLSFVAGDRLGIFLTDTGVNANKITVIITYEVTSSVLTDGGSPTIP